MDRHSKIAAGIVLALSGLFVIAGNAFAAEHYDIDNSTPATVDWPNGLRGSTGVEGECQSFQPINATLDGIDFTWTMNGSSDEVTLLISSGNCWSGSGASAVIATSELHSSLPSGASPDVYRWTFASPISVTPGDTYYFTVRSSNATIPTTKYWGGSATNCGTYCFFYDASDTYAGGVAEWVDISNNVTATGKDIWFRTFYDAPGCVLDSATAAVTSSGAPTISAAGTCDGFYADTAWLGAVRIDPVGAHASWSEGYGPFADPYTLSTADVAKQELSNGTWRVRMYARSGTTTYVSENYVDVVLDGSAFTPLTAESVPLDEWDITEDNTPISVDSGGEGYVLSASAVELAARGGLRITADGCGAVGEDATSTRCAAANGALALQNAFPLLTWPLGIFNAVTTAWKATEDASTTYAIELPSPNPTWAPEVVLVDSASRTRGIGAWISVERQTFFRSIASFAIWVMFVLSLKRKAFSLLT